MWDWIEAETQEKADDIAYESWREDAESQGDYSAEEENDDLRQKYPST